MTLRLKILSLVAGLACASLVACDGGDGTGADAGSQPGTTGNDGFDDTEDPIDVGNGGEMPGAADAGKDRDAGKANDGGVRQDAGKRRDAGDSTPTYDCEEEFVFDPSGLDNVSNVVLTGNYSRWTSWVPTASSGAIPMALGDDGRYHARVFLKEEVFEYKFVVNGDSATPTWVSDAANCHSTNDTYGGRNSIHYACQTAPECEEPTEPDAGPDASVGADAGAGDAAAGDAGDSHDSGVIVSDASVGMDAAVGDAAVGDADVGEQDAGDEDDVDVDVELGDDCVESFEVDPADYPELAPIVSVELRGDAPLSYEEAVIELHEDADGIFRASARVDKLQFKYNVLLNGKDYARDRGYCPSADDGFGGRGASLRSTCEVPACCEEIVVAWQPAASACGDVESAHYVGQLASWAKPGIPMTLGDDGTFRISFRDAPGSYEYKVIVQDAYMSAPDDNCADDGEAALVVKACVN